MLESAIRGDAIGSLRSGEMAILSEAVAEGIDFSGQTGCHSRKPE